MRTLHFVMAFALSAAVSAALPAGVRADERPEFDGPTCSGYGDKSCRCHLTSCSVIQGKTRCSLECTFRWVIYA